MTNIFEQATRKGLRFASQKGLLTVEDLWDLPLTSTKGVSLDDIAKNLYRQLKTDDNFSFVNDAILPGNADVQLAFDVVKHIIDVIKAENATAKNARDVFEKKQKLLALIAEKQDDALKSTSLEELQKMVEAL